MRFVSSKEVALVSGGEQEVSYVAMLDTDGYFSYYDYGEYNYESSFPAYTGSIDSSPSFTDVMAPIANAAASGCAAGVQDTWNNTDGLPSPTDLAGACINGALENTIGIRIKMNSD